jgi:hypothetical protein
MWGFALLVWMPGNCGAAECGMTIMDAGWMKVLFCLMKFCSCWYMGLLYGAGILDGLPGGQEMNLVGP